MTPSEYRKAFDDISFSADFQERTVAMLCEERRQAEKKENQPMKNRIGRTTALIAAMVALLALSVSAVMILLSPAQVAGKMDAPVLAAAFDTEDAVVVDKTLESDGFAMTLAGLVSGKGLAAWGDDVDESRTYMVLSLAHTDGTPLENETFDYFKYTITPLVSGYGIGQVNTWTLGTFAQGIIEDGVAYYILDTQDLQMFADHTVYLAMYEGGVPSPAIFNVAADEAISFVDGMEGPHALFTLPLNAALADPVAAEAFVEGTGIPAPSSDGGEAADEGVVGLMTT